MKGGLTLNHLLPNWLIDFLWTKHDSKKDKKIKVVVPKALPVIKEGELYINHTQDGNAIYNGNAKATEAYQHLLKDIHSRQ